MSCGHHDRFLVKIDPNDELTICLYCHCLKLQSTCISVQNHLEAGCSGSYQEQAALRTLAGDHLDQAMSDLCDVLSDPLLPWDL